MKKLAQFKTGRGIFTKEDLSEKRFGHLMVVGPASKGVKWLCKCDCGNEVVIGNADIIAGHNKSCGCHQFDAGKTAALKHGATHSTFYEIWYSMRRRCNSPLCHAYKNYGGRGILVCERWNNYQNFKDDMYNTYLEHKNRYGVVKIRYNTTLERKNNDKGYSPQNCIWATYSEQNYNRRR